MVIFLKCFLGVFILAGIAISLYGAREILGTMSFVKNVVEHTTGTFIDYEREDSAASTSSSSWDQHDIHDSRVLMSFPQFEFVAKDGTKTQVRESKQHVIERFKPGQEVEILISPYGDHRLAGFYSLYFRDLCIFILGLLFIIVPLTIGRIALPILKTSAGIELEKQVSEQYQQIAASRIGPVAVSTIFKGAAIFVVLTTLIALSSALSPFVNQLHLGFGWDLIEALNEERFEDARKLIVKGKGINKVNEYNQNPLLLALEAGQFDLARLLIKAGSDVNIKSKMYMTPLRVAVQSGNIEMVRLLLSKGASPDTPEDELPPVYYALAKKHDEIARILVESGCDLKRCYIHGNSQFTVGDLTIMAGKPELTELIRGRGGSFSPRP
jgi:hypothetical protein